MPHPILDRLTLLRRRQEMNLLLAGAGRGLVTGAAGAMVLALLLWAAWLVPASRPLVRAWLPVGLASVAGVAVLAGLATGIARRARAADELDAVAALVDAEEHLQDRAVTALAFLRKSERSELAPMEELQLAEAADRLASIDPTVVVPRRWPRSLGAGAGLLFVAAGLIADAMFFPPPPARQAAAEPKPVARPPAKAVASKPAGPAIGWQPAPAARVAAARSSVMPALELDQIVAEAARTADAQTSSGATPPPTVLEGERVPLEYRKILRQYFEAIRP